MTTAELLTLPVDILSLFFDHLAQRERKKLRLVCRSLHSLVPLRFPRVFLSPNKTNIEAFRGIAENEVFRNQVYEIVWDDARLELYERQKPQGIEAAMLREDLRLGTGEWQGGSKTFPHFCNEVLLETTSLEEEERRARKMELWGTDVPDMEFDDSFELYNQLYDEQQAIIEAGEDVETLTLGLLSFPSLKRLTVTSEAWRIKPLFPKFETPFFRSLPPGFYMAQPWPWIGTDCNDATGKQEEMLLTPWDTDHEEWRGYEIAVDALLATAAHHKVEEFLIDTNYELTGITHQLFAHAENSGYTKTLQLFQTLPLTTLELSLNVHCADESQYGCFHNGLLKQALSHLPSLRRLALSTSIDTLDDETTLDDTASWLRVDEILPISSLAPHLQSLKLCNLLLHGDSLYEALTQLGTLQTLWLDCIALHDTMTWRDFAVRVKDRLVQPPSPPASTPNAPAIVFRRKASTLFYRLDSSAELRAFLHAEADCPFTPLHPQVANVGCVVNTFDPADKECEKMNAGDFF